MEGIKTESLYIVGVHRYCFQAGKPAAVLGIEMCTPENSTPRPCLHILFEDTREDYIALSDIQAGNWQFTTEGAIANGNIPVIDR